MSNNQLPSIVKKEELADGSIYIEYDNGLITFESAIEYFFPEYNRYMSQQQYNYLEKKKHHEKMLERLPPKEKEKIKKL